MSDPRRSPASFRDPTGFIFERDGRVYRHINAGGMADFHRLMDSGLYRELVSAGLLIPHRDAEPASCCEGSPCRVIEPERIPFISYPYEWSFAQLRDAALLTLEIQRRALSFDMALKDATAYNVQFRDGKPMFIDTLSFEVYREGEPWVAYQQFCRFFLAPLALMSLVDIRLGRLLQVEMEGIPLDMAAALLPSWTRLRPALLVHLHVHAWLQRRTGKGTARSSTSRTFGRSAMLGLIDSLEAAVRRLRWRPPSSVWADYEREHNYSPSGLAQKRRFVGEALDHIAPRTVWDLGANTGQFSRIAAERGALTMAFDADPSCVERTYREAVARGESRILPLVMDLTNPSPAIGWQNRERMALEARGPADAVLALALVHHLAIAANVPLDRIASFLAAIGRWLVIEFVPKDDPQVQRLLASRRDVFADYHKAHFEACFGQEFEILGRELVPGTDRELFLMRKRGVE